MDTEVDAMDDQHEAHVMHHCIGCGCDEEHACNTDGLPCQWLRVDDVLGTGICSNPACELLTRRWDEVDHTSGEPSKRFEDMLRILTREGLRLYRYLAAGELIAYEFQPDLRMLLSTPDGIQEMEVDPVEGFNPDVDVFPAVLHIHESAASALQSVIGRQHAAAREDSHITAADLNDGAVGLLELQRAELFYFPMFGVVDQRKSLIVIAR